MPLDTGDPEVDLGTDVRLYGDLAGAWGLASGFVNLGYALARRLTTPRGRLFYDLSYGTYVPGFINGKMNPTDVASLKAAISSECEKDERVQNAEVDVDVDRVSRKLTITISIDTADGPFDLVLAATDVTVAVLAIGGVEAPAVIAPVQNLVIRRGEKGDTGDTGPAGVGGGGGSGGIVLDDPGELGNASDPAAEVVVYEEAVPLGGLDANITVTLAGRFMSASGTSIFRVRVGGSSETADGTIAATVSTSSGSFSAGTNNTTIANPGGSALVKITIENGAAAAYGRARAMTISITD